MVDPFYCGDGLTVYNADVLDALAALPPESVDAVVTSPPYAMQRKATYGGIPEKDYPDWTVAWMGTLKPALTERGSVMINISPHVKDGMLSDYVLRTRLALRDAGWYEHDELVWHKPNAFPVGAKTRPTRSWESILWYSRTSRPWVDLASNGNCNPRTDVGFGRVGVSGAYGIPSNTVPKVANCRNHVSLGVGGKTNWLHPAQFPVGLAEWCGKLICPPCGTILDPFAGSGSTAIAALRNGWQSIAIDQVPEYAQMIVDRYCAEVQKDADTLDLEVAGAES